MKKIISCAAALALCVSGFAFGGLSVAAEETEKEYFNAAKTEYFVTKEGPNCSITMEDVVDYNGVEGDTGLLVTMSPVVKDTTFTNGYVYMNIPVDVTDVEVTLKVLGPTTDGATGANAQAHFNNKVQWWSVGFNQKMNTDLFAESAKSVTYMMWGMKTKLMENGYWQGETNLSCNTDWGATYSVGEHTFGLSASESDPNNFAFKADGIFPAQCDPYAGTQSDTSASLNPFQMHVSDFENNQAYFHLGMAQPAVGEQNCEDFVVLIKSIEVEKVYPESVKIGNGSITELEKEIGEKFTLQPTFTPAAGVTETDVTWSSDNEAVAKVNAETGEIETLAVGEANITVTTVNGKTASIKIKVVEEIDETEPGGNEQGGDNTGNNDEDKTPTEDKGGCGSVLFAGTGAAVLAAGAVITASGTVLLRRKRK